MFRWLVGLALLAFVWVPAGAQAQSTMGYDAHGRLICVYHPTTPAKITKYSYDASGNRTTKVVEYANGQSCASQPVGPPPTLPVQLTAINVSEDIPSDGSDAWAMGALGASSDNATLSLLSATTTGGAGACGTASTTSSLLSYTAPNLTPASATLTCYIDYVFSHPNGQQKSGRVTATILGEDPPGGGGGDPEPCVPNPQTGLCEIE